MPDAAAIKVEALRTFRYATRDVQRGDVIEMSSRDARLMSAVRNVRAVEAAPSATATAGAYQRRDMRAEEPALVIPTFKRGPGRPPKAAPAPAPVPPVPPAPAPTPAPAPAPSQPLGTGNAPGLTEIGKP
jgi:hypothetical protein